MEKLTKHQEKCLIIARGNLDNAKRVYADARKRYGLTRHAANWIIKKAKSVGGKAGDVTIE